MTRARVAVVGSGPAGAYTAMALLASRARPEVDLLDRLPTPWGLLRGGVAPDHQEIKRLAAHFEAHLVRPGCRFFGGVEVGRDLRHADLRAHYDAVVYATGAQTGRRLGIDGEDLAGVVSATELVGFYNGHPDAPARLDLSTTRAVVVGNGNVAADIARVLLRPVDALARTDIADRALAALRAGAVREVVVLGRRGPAQAAFTSAELRDLLDLEDVDVVLDPAEVELDAVSREWLEAKGTFTARRNVELLEEAARRPAGARPASRRIVLRFLRSPVAVRGVDGRVTGVEVVRNELVRDAVGVLRAKPTGRVETIACGLLVPSVGYRAVRLPDVPFDAAGDVLPNAAGRVVDPATGARVRGVYTVGWAKRGPTGVLGTNKRDARETVGCLVADLEAGALEAPAVPGREAVARLIAERVPAAVPFDGWARIDAAERAAGEAGRRPRVKLTTTEDLLAHARA